MALIYRAIWQEDRTTLFDDAEATVLAWLKRKGLPIDGLPDNDEVSGRWTDPRFGSEAEFMIRASRATVNDTSGFRVRLVEDRYESGLQWTTTLTVLDQTDEPPTIWVDVERQNLDPFSYVPFVAPTLVRTLISQGVDPRVGHVRLADHPVITTVPGLVGLIRNEDRRLPIAVFSHDPITGLRETMKRAEAAHKRLAGVAQVFVLPREDVTEFRTLIGEDLAVWGGGARLYLPNTGPQGMSPNRHRYIPGGRAKTSTVTAGEYLVSQLVTTVPATSEPVAYRKIRAELLGISRDDKELLALALNDNSELTEQVKRLRVTVDMTEDANDDLVVDNEDLSTELARMQSHLARILREMHNPITDGDIDETPLPETVESIGDAIQAATNLRHVAIHPEAPVEIDKLDAAVTAGAWANRIWSALRALDAYASTPAEEAASFFDWCREGSSPWTWPSSTKKLSMTESEYVQNRLLDTRRLPIDPAVDPSGRIIMLAHMKIAEGGGPLAPRIYFYDDTRGPTGKVHVGYIGPHANMPNKGTN